MESCTVIFFCEGPTDVAVVGACLEKNYGALTDVLETGNLRNFRSKILISDVGFGLFTPDKGGLEQAEKSFQTMATNKAIRGLHPKLKHVCMVRDMNGHGSVELEGRFRDLVAQIGTPEVQANDLGNGMFQLPDLSLRQILMGDPEFGASDHNAIDDHVVDCLCQADRSELADLTGAFETITSKPPTSKQIVTLAMALDEHLGNPTRYYEEVIKNSPREWIAEFMVKIGLEAVIQAGIARS